MTNATRRLTDIIAYLEEHIDAALDVDTLCQVVHLSKFHFHRFCSANFGLPVMSLLRLLRLKRAAFQLAYREQLKVVDIAFEAGYESHEAFSRAFKRVFQQSPMDFKQQPNWASWHSKYEPIFQLRSNTLKPTDYTVKLVEFQPVQVAMMEHKGAPETLGKTLQAFIGWRKANGLPPTKSRTFNLVYDDPNTTAPEAFRFGLACEITRGLENYSEGMVGMAIPEGKCAVIRHVGSDDSLGAAVDYLYGDWLMNSGDILRDFPLFFERVSFFSRCSRT